MTGDGYQFLEKGKKHEAEMLGDEFGIPPNWECSPMRTFWPLMPACSTPKTPMIHILRWILRQVHFAMLVHFNGLP